MLCFWLSFLTQAHLLNYYYYYYVCILVVVTRAAIDIFFLLFFLLSGRSVLVLECFVFAFAFVTFIIYI